MTVVNSNPGKQAQVLISAVPGTNTVDANVTVVDRNPLSAYVMLANTGTSDTGMDRLTVGMQHANVFDRDQVANFSYTTAPSHLHEVSQFGGSYLIPLYGIGGTVSFYYFHSDVNSGRVAGLFDVTGKGDFAGANFTYVLSRWNGIAPSLSISLENRYFDNNIGFAGQPIGGAVRSSPLSVRLQGKEDESWGKAQAYLERVTNLPEGSESNDAAYEAARPGAESHWAAWRLGGDLGINLPEDWQLAGRLRAQITNKALISGEQFGVGGMWSVRGFAERAFAGDSGWFTSIETTTPKLISDLRGAAFIDLGGATLHGTPGTEGSSNTVSSVGIGLRYRANNGIEANADFAHVMSGIPGIQDSGSWRVHAIVIYRF